MRFIYSLWLEIIEGVFLFLTLVALLVASRTQQYSPFYLLLTVDLMLGVIGRWRAELRHKARIAAALNIQLKRFSAQLAELKENLHQFLAEDKASIIPPKLHNTPKSDDEVIASLQEDIDSINRSITSIISYIKEHNIELRLKNLEKLYQGLQAPRKGLELPDKNVLQESKKIDILPPPRLAWRCIHIIKAHSQSVTDLAITADGKYLLTTSWDQHLRLWSLKDGTEVSGTEAAAQGVLCLCVRKDNYQDFGVATGGLDQLIRVWSLVPGKKSLEFRPEYTLTHHTGSIHCLAMATGQNLLLSGSYDQTLKQWELTTSKLVCSCYHQAPVSALAVDEENGYVACGASDGTISLWQLGAEQQLGVLVGNMAKVEAVAISHTGEIIAAACADGTIKLWKLPTTIFSIFLQIEPFLELNAHHGQVMDLSWSPDSQLLYSAGTDGLIKIWYPASGEELGHLKINDSNRIFCLSLSKDGRMLAAGGVDGTVKVWEQK
ncbi:MAG: WD40 repeat domain-containing protein [Geminocystis sp.]|nr:WD40 repeat domain-containing protein [Geminocystis sp.]HIK36528.1 WD40 repeat domain-containing protein [Geminocystis sp. M7585_C2015_104]MCS7146726.1 WD40 repeat domain-containing protein [Geminocystis sp.]MCX8077124.1 WD40 repeat domain-containing protein [Geminocystis sp.]MDW8115552.1 WD40 repeat domain-containing protein [Geminocystis sp.]